ncbi:MAG: phage holin family protein [Verrucomicrobiota bacterium]
MAAIPIILRLIAVTWGLAVAQWTASGVVFQSGLSFVGAVALLGIFLTLLKPVLVLLMLPLVVLTLGLGLWVVNALIVMLASAIIPGFDLATWGSAFWTALWVSLFTLGTIAVTGKNDQRFRKVVLHQSGFRRNVDPKKKVDNDDFIDI